MGDLPDPRWFNDPSFRELVLDEYERLYEKRYASQRPPMRRERVTNDDVQIRQLPPVTGQRPLIVDALPSPKQQKKHGSTLIILAAAIIIGAIALLGGTIAETSSPTSNQRSEPTACPGYSVLCAPTVSASFINQVLSHYSSPAVGDGQALYNLGVQYGIDPAYPLAFFMNESSFGTAGEARVTLSLGNSRCIPDRACVNTTGALCQTGQSCYAKMNSWEDGFEHWYELIRNAYVTGAINRDIGRNACPCITVPEIIPVYAPNSDGNNELHYIQAVEHAVDTWRSGKIAV